MPLKIRCRFCGKSHKYLEVFSNTLQYREKNLGKKGRCVNCNMPLFKLKHHDGSEYSFSEYQYLAKSCFLPKALTKKQDDTTTKTKV